MSDPNAAEEKRPVFRLEKMYVKDLSFENPNSPEVFRRNLKPQAEVNLSIRNKKVEGAHWEVVLSVTTSLKSEEEVVFIVEVEHAGLFLLQNIPEEHLPAVLAVECPTLLFPFTRQIICQAVVDGGFVPFLLDPVNFLAMFKSSRQKSPEGQPTH